MSHTVTESHSDGNCKNDFTLVVREARVDNTIPVEFLAVGARYN